MNASGPSMTKLYSWVTSFAASTHPFKVTSENTYKKVQLAFDIKSYMYSLSQPIITYKYLPSNLLLGLICGPPPPKSPFVTHGVF